MTDKFTLGEVVQHVVRKKWLSALRSSQKNPVIATDPPEEPCLITDRKVAWTVEQPGDKRVMSSRSSETF